MCEGLKHDSALCTEWRQDSALCKESKQDSAYVRNEDQIQLCVVNQDKICQYHRNACSMYTEHIEIPLLRIKIYQLQKNFESTNRLIKIQLISVWNEFTKWLKFKVWLN